MRNVLRVTSPLNSYLTTELLLSNISPLKSATVFPIKSQSLLMKQLPISNSSAIISFVMNQGLCTRRQQLHWDGPVAVQSQPNLPTLKKSSLPLPGTEVTYSPCLVQFTGW